MKKSSTLWIIIAFLALSISLTSVFIAFSPQLVGDKLGADESDASSDTSADSDDEWTKEYGDESDNIHFGPIHQIGSFDGEIDTDLSEDSDTEAGDNTDTGSDTETGDSTDTGSDSETYTIRLISSNSGDSYTIELDSDIQSWSSVLLNNIPDFSEDPNTHEMFYLGFGLYLDEDLDDFVSSKDDIEQTVYYLSGSIV